MMPLLVSLDISWPHFENEAALWLLLLLLLPIVLWRIAKRGRIQVVQMWLGEGHWQLAAGGIRRWPGRIVLLLIMVGLVLALARPQWGTESITPVHEARDLMLLVDVSQSMLAEDRPPASRLLRAKQSIEQLLTNLQQRRDATRIGIGIFAGNARILCPPTEDLEHVRQVVQDMGPDSFGPSGRLQENEPAGTSFRSAVSLAADWLKKNSEDEPFIDCLLISDGDDVGGDTSEAIGIAEGAKLTLNVLGIGDAQRDWPIPVKNGYLMTPNPQTGVQERVLTRRHDEQLKQLALHTGGKVVLEESESEPIVTWWSENSAGHPRRALESITRQVPVSRTDWLLVLVSFLLVVEVCFGGTRKRDW
jgi:Ca-activated chloride channel family protein